MPVDTTATLDSDDPVSPDPALPEPSPRYRPLAVLGRGGMATVYLCRDLVFDRDVAMKVANPGASAVAIRRFDDEARITAGLDHPGVVPVHDLGRTTDGRPYLVMQRVDGRTLREVLDARDRPVRGLLADLRSVAETIASAHARDIHHRDLKPENVMVGRFGEVRVMDWGIARRGAARHEADPAGIEAVAAALTAVGSVTGTPAYMAPEQAHGEDVGPPADVFALGLVLVELVAGRPARMGGDVLQLVYQATRPVAIPEMPDALRRLAGRALHPRPTERPSAAEFAAALEDWLAGAERADLGRARIADAKDLFALERALRVREGVLEDELRAVADDPARVRERWLTEDRLRALAFERHRRAADVDRLLGLAQAHAAELPELHETLAEVALDRCERAELAGDALEADRHEALVRRHDRGGFADWLAGDGALTLHTVPAGLSVIARRCEARDRLRIPGEPMELGTTPLDRVPLGRGSWHLEVGGHVVPVEIRRAEHWDGVPPDGAATEPLRLPELVAGEVWVPPGWYRAGGDPLVRNPRAAARVWVDGFSIRVHPVTNAEYLGFLHTVAATLSEDALGALVPRPHNGITQARGAPLYRVDGRRFAIDSPLRPEMPVVCVSWHAARAFARWEADRTGLSWRLPTFAEREKAARGVDGRAFPWGDDWAPDRSNAGLSRPEGPELEAVGARPLDRSVYGVEGLAGNVSDWVLDGFHAALEPRTRAVVRPLDEEFAAFAGGAWNSGAVYGRAANLGRYRPDMAVSALGFRLARSI